MATTTRSLIAQLQKDRRFKGTCPSCNDEFFLADAILYSIGDEPPEAAIAAIQMVREQIKERQADIANAMERMSTRAQKTSEAVNIGKIVEKIIPSFASFTHQHSDCRALFEPIDYVIFTGLCKRGIVDSLLFVDVKSGGARLTKDQKAIRDAVTNGNVEFLTIEKAV